MPELPEVETVRRGLSQRIVGETVASVEVRHAGILEDCRGADLEGLASFRIHSVDRKAKYLLLRLRSPAGSKTLVVHLGMTGQLTWRAKGETVTDQFRRLVSGYAKSVDPHRVDGHTHLVAICESGGELLFRDPRRFGRVLLLDGDRDENCPRLAKLGPDAWRLDAAVLGDRLRAFAGRRSVKSVLLDQTVVAGIGNIYADEACFAAKVRPDRNLADLSPARMARLARAIDAVLEKGVQNAGTSFRDFVASDGTQGRNQEDLRVYGRKGLECLDCGGALRGATVAQRTTVWCQNCQT